MSKVLLCMTAAATLALSGPAFATASKMAPPKTPPASDPGPAPGTTPSATTTTPDTGAAPAPPAPTGTAADTSTTAPAAATVLAVGLPVKDNTGATIGSVSELKADASGAQNVTITMGPDRFAVTADKLAVANGAATINLTQAQITDMLHKPK